MKKSPWTLNLEKWDICMEHETSHLVLSTHFITSPSRMLRNIHPRCIKSPSSNHFPFSQELDESGHKPFTSGRWDQFKANEELFGYVSTYKAGKPVVGNDVKNQGCWVNLGNWLEADVFETHGFHACVGYFCLGRFWKIQYSITLLVFFYKNPYNICCAFSFLTLFNTSSEVNPISF